MSSESRIPPAGDGFYVAAQTEAQEELAKLEERYRHEDLGIEERLELRDRVVRLRRRSSKES